MTVTPDEPGRDADHRGTAARAARRARRIGGRSRPTGPDEALPGPDEVPPAPAPAVPPGPPTEAAAPRPPAGGWWTWLPAALLAAACAAFVAVGVVDSHGVWWDRGATGVAGERGAVLAAAKSCMATMNTYDYRKLDAAEAKGLACATGKLTGQYKTAFETVVEKQAPKLKATQSAQINDAGIESVSGDGRQWVVLVFGQLTTTSSQTGSKTPPLTPFSARVTMERVGGKWLVGNYQYAPGA